MLIPVILAGGVGSRLWPLSRDIYPKQLLSLTGGHSLFQTTLLRASQIPDAEGIIIICGQQYQFLIEEQLNDLKNQICLPIEIILEPMGKNTAPALALAALQTKNHPDALLLALPADNLINDSTIFFQQIEKVKNFARENIIIFGVRPAYPETGYGYIQTEDVEGDIYPITSFVEKPELTKAELFFRQKNYYWNSGIFLFNPQVYLSELQSYAPDIFFSCEKAWHSRTERDEVILIDTLIYSSCPSLSIDYAIMEKTQLAVMTRLESTWTDVGSWLAVADNAPADKENNICKGDIVTINTRDCYLHSESRLLTAVGLKDLVVVETRDAVLVLNKSCAQDVKLLVDKLKRNDRQEVKTRAFMYQPWGYFEVLCKMQNFTVRRFSMKPHANLLGTGAAGTFERWIILDGSVQFISAGKSSLLSANQFVEILPDTLFNFINLQKASIQLLCIQTHYFLESAGTDVIEEALSQTL